MTTVVAVFLKEPIPGRVKTRCIPHLGEEGATLLYERLLRHTLERLGCLDSELFRISYWVDGDAAALAHRFGLAANAILQQPEGDLGHRLTTAMEHEFGEGARCVQFVGTDCPDLEARHVRQARAILERSEAVIGPARDGGYYLLGLKTPEPTVFHDISWSSPQTCAQTIERFENAGLAYAKLEKLNDIDDADDLRELRDRFPELVEGIHGHQSSENAPSPPSD